MTHPLSKLSTHARRVARRQFDGARSIARGISGTAAEGAPNSPGGLADGGSGWWNLFPFTTHQIELADGVSTMRAGEGVDVKNDVRMDLVADAASGLERYSVMDLGSLEGGFTIESVRRGAASALGLEARESHVERARLAAQLAHLPTVTFEVADINERLAHCEKTEIVLATGILYHVADPAAVLTEIRRLTTGALVLDTHVAHRSDVTHHCSDPTTVTSATGKQYDGRWFREYDGGIATEDKEELIWAAWSDENAFWPFEDELVQMLSDAGFSTIEKIDTEGWTKRNRWFVDQANRVLYVARP